MKLPHQSHWLSGSLAFFGLFVSSSIQAQQIVPDATLPRNSIVAPNGKNATITGGTQSGPNLLHSFKEFSVPTDGGASFEGVDQGIENVLSRVTGTSKSRINGLIEVRQANGSVSSANFFLLNPNGIVFGSKAELNIGGSFLASTASSLKFNDGREFSATNPQTAPLLTISVPIGLQFDRATRKIVNQSIASDGSNEYFGLAVQPGKTLALIGGEVALEDGILTAPEGRIELGSVVGSGLVSLNTIDNGWTLGYEGIQNFGNIQLSQGSYVDASGKGGGNIQVQGGPVTLTGSSVITADTLGSQNGGEIFIRASQLNIESSSLVIASTISDSLGKGGNVIVETGKLRTLDGGRVFAGTFGEGPGGNLTVTASDSVELVGIARKADGEPISDQDDPVFSGLFTQTFSQAEEAGAAGNLVLQTGKLIVREGAQVNATTFGTGDAGNLTVQASEIELVGDALLANGKLLTDQNGLPFPSGLFAGTGKNSTGDGGILRVETNRLSLRDGAVLQTSTLGAGDAGNLIVQASEFVEVVGTAKGAVKKDPTSLLAVSGGLPKSGRGVPKATGKGGSLTINTGQLLVQDGAVVAVGSLNETNEARGAGNLDVQAQTVRLNNRGELTAATAAGDGGSIRLRAQDLLLLSNNSNISTNAGIAGTIGQGGNITVIDTGNLVALGNSDITANATKDRGGKVNITAEGVFGTAAREQQTPVSDITASSDLGPQFSGTVQINTPDVDPSEGLTNLPTEPVNTEIAQDCQAGGGKTASRFINSGSGGLPTNPYEPLDSSDILAEVQLPSQWADAEEAGTQGQGDTGILPHQQMPLHHTSASRQATPPSQIVEAQGWSVNDKGEVSLVAEVPSTSSQRGCRLR